MVYRNSSTSSSLSEGGSDGYIDGLDSEAEDAGTDHSSPTSSRASVIAANDDDLCGEEVQQQTQSEAALLGQSLQSIEHVQLKEEEASPVSSPASSGFSLDLPSSCASQTSAATSMSLHQQAAVSSHTCNPQGKGKHVVSPSPSRNGLRSSDSSSLAHARSLLEHQAASLLSAARRLREEEETWEQFEDAQHLVVKTLKGGGKVVWTGVGKSGIIASKLSSTSLSLGLPATYLDPLSALHGDLGLLNGSPSQSRLVASSSSASQLPAPPSDVLIALSHSGSSPELLAILPHVELRGVKVIALTAQRDSELGKAALKAGGSWIDCRTAGRGAEQQEESSTSEVTEDMGHFSRSRGRSTSSCPQHPSSGCCSTSSLFSSSLTSALTAGTDEADPCLPAPTSSTTTALAMGDSLVLSCARMLGLGTTKEFGKNHPGGALGKRMMAELEISQKTGTEEEGKRI